MGDKATCAPHHPSHLNFSSCPNFCAAKIQDTLPLTSRRTVATRLSCWLHSTYFGVVLLSCVVFYDDSIHVANTHSCFQIRLLKKNVTLFDSLVWVFVVRSTW